MPDHDNPSLSPTYAGSGLFQARKQLLHSLVSNESVIAENTKEMFGKLSGAVNTFASSRKLGPLAREQLKASVFNRVGPNAHGVIDGAFDNVSLNATTIPTQTLARLQEQNRKVADLSRQGQTLQMGTINYFVATRICREMSSFQPMALMFEASGLWNKGEQKNLNHAITRGEGSGAEDAAYRAAIPYYAMAEKCLANDIPLQYLRSARCLVKKNGEEEKKALERLYKDIPGGPKRENLFRGIMNKTAADSIEQNLPSAKKFLERIFSNGVDQLRPGLQKEIAEEANSAGLNGKWFESQAENFDRLYELPLSSYGRPAQTTDIAKGRKIDPKQQSIDSHWDRYLAYIQKGDFLKQSPEKRFQDIFGAGIDGEVERLTTQIPEKERAYFKTSFPKSVMTLLDGTDKEHSLLYSLEKSKGVGDAESIQRYRGDIANHIREKGGSKLVVDFLTSTAHRKSGGDIAQSLPEAYRQSTIDPSMGPSSTAWHYLTMRSMCGMPQNGVLPEALYHISAQGHHSIDEVIKSAVDYRATYGLESKTFDGIIDDRGKADDKPSMHKIQKDLFSQISSGPSWSDLAKNARKKETLNLPLSQRVTRAVQLVRKPPEEREEIKTRYLRGGR